MALTPKSENAKTLLETEKCYLASSTSSCILRLGGIYGPHRELIDRACKLSGKEMTSPQAPTNHIHLDDILRALVFCLDHSLTGVYHLVNDDHLTRQDLYSDLCLSAQIPSPQWNFDSPQSGCKVSNQKIKDAAFIFKHPSLKTSNG